MSIFNKVFLSVALFLFGSSSLYSQGETWSVWGENLPNSKGLPDQEVEVGQRVRQVKTPTLTAFFPNQENNSGVVMIICPGGGYRHLAIHKEGYQTAKWLNTQGITAFVLKYRLPVSEDLKIPYKAPLQDLQRSIKLIRSQAATWEIDPDKIGVMGFSAGGHLAASAGTHFEEDWSNIGDELDTLSCRPNFMVLMYPVISFKPPIASKSSGKNLLGSHTDEALIEHFSLENHVTLGTPPTFLVATDDDTAVPVENSLLFYQRLRKYHIRSALHVFPKGGHGFGLGNGNEGVGQWPELLISWMRDMCILECDWPKRSNVYLIYG